MQSQVIKTCHHGTRDRNRDGVTRSRHVAPNVGGEHPESSRATELEIGTAHGNK